VKGRARKKEKRHWRRSDLHETSLDYRERADDGREERKAEPKSGLFDVKPQKVVL